MGTLTITASGFSTINGSKTYTASDADWDTLISYMQIKYAPNASPGVPAPLTPAQALLAWVQDWVMSTREEIRFKQLQDAQKLAASQATVTPIVFT